MESRIVEDKETGDKVFEVWIEGGKMITLFFVEGEEEPYTFVSGITEIENLISAYTIILNNHAVL